MTDENEAARQEAAELIYMRTVEFQEKIKQDALDAARYRVLRDPLCNHGVLPTGRKLDDYCDAAISAEKKEKA